jgi:ankyrin repeat protein
VAEYLLKNKADPNARDKDGDPILLKITVLVPNPDPGLVGLLVDAGAKVNYQDGMGTLLSRAVRAAAPKQGPTGVPALVSLLAERGADVKAGDRKNGITPVMEAVACGNPDTVRYLVGRGSDLGAVDAHGQNAFVYAIAECSDAVFDLLVASRVPLTTADINRFHLLWRVGGERVYNMKKVRYMVGKGADVNNRPPDYDTPLQQAIAHDCAECVIYLLESGADVKARGACGRSTVHFAGSPAMADLLGSRGADLKAVDATGENALIATSRYKRFVMARYFLEKRVFDLNHRDKGGWTALTRLAFSGPDNFREWAGLLIAAGADVNAEDNKGMTPLMHAVAWRNLNAVKCLLERGADAKRRDRSGKTAADHARDILRKYGASAANASEISALLN